MVISNIGYIDQALNLWKTHVFIDMYILDDFHQALTAPLVTLDVVTIVTYTKADLFTTPNCSDKGHHA